MKKIALSEAKDQLSRYLRVAEREEIVIRRHGKPAGVLIGFGSEDDWFDYRLETDPRFLSRIEQARASLRAGKGVPLENVDAARVRSNKRLQPARPRRLTTGARRRARG
ncbi:MAG: type II toxin-antitoxin system Phd/YefM family antitoxin [Deltaproteobacteria bacterium]|nr:type II toxin-antitoxin system Phd/YefM family antitoxin [Deltaproteobacteria bacterium]